MADAIRMLQMNSLWVFNLSFSIILYTIKIKMGIHNANATVIQAQYSSFVKQDFLLRSFILELNLVSMPVKLWKLN